MMGTRTILVIGFWMRRRSRKGVGFVQQLYGFQGYPIEPSNQYLSLLDDRDPEVTKGSEGSSKFMISLVYSKKFKY